jgi:hypothetical protein
MKRYWGEEVQLHPFLTSVLDGQSFSYPGRFTPEERVSGIRKLRNEKFGNLYYSFF